jgi:hypothetical protein
MFAMMPWSPGRYCRAARLCSRERLSPAAREAHRQRVRAFTHNVPRALRDSEIRDGLTRTEAGELLWSAHTGALLMSGALDEEGPAVFDRMAIAWNSALRSIVPDGQFPGFEQFVKEVAEQYGQRR